MIRQSSFKQKLLLGTSLSVLPLSFALADQAISQGEGFVISLSDEPVPVVDTLPQWYGTGLIDLTFGKREARGQEATDYNTGRAAFFVQGDLQSGYKVTASADTGTGDIKDMFRRLDNADPNVILQRMRQDGKTTYSTYGDDSSIVDATPTDGRVYVRVENETSHIMWGNFSTQAAPLKLGSGSRSLYGASASIQIAAKNGRWPSESKAFCIFGKAKFSGDARCAKGDRRIGVLFVASKHFGRDRQN